MKRFVLALWMCAAFVVPSWAAPALSEFQRNNPDAGAAKFEFGRSYISALSYIYAIDHRWKTTSPKKIYTGGDVALMRGYVTLLIKDNVDLRIAKNYLSKYLDSPNALVRKTADIFIGACVLEIALNDKEKQIWDQWYAVKSNKLDTPANERAFVKALQDLSLQHKNADKSIIEASVLLTKVLRSSQNSDDKGKVLALTAKQRQQLLDALDEFGKDFLDWGLRPGQRSIEASVSVIREILEDTIYKTTDE